MSLEFKNYKELIDAEIKWAENNKGNVNKNYVKGFIFGLNQSLMLWEWFKQIEDDKDGKDGK